MRLLVGIAEMGIGGAEAVVEELALHRLGRGDDISVVSAGGFRADRLASSGVRLVPAALGDRRPAALARASAAVRREIKQHRPDLVHVHNVKAAAILRAGALPRRLPTLVTLHGVPDAEYASAARILRRAGDRVVAVSGEVADRIVAAGYPRERTSIIENAIQAPTPHDRAEARGRLGLAEDRLVAVCIARLVDQKRHDLLIEAWRSLPGDAVLLVVGDGPNRERIAAHAAADPRIRLLGLRTDVDWLLAAADLSVLPTDWEGLPISVLEAMAAGVPVVASRVAGLEPVAEAAELVTPGTPAALAEGLSRVLTDADRRRRLRAAALALIAGRFGVEQMRAAYDAEYDRLLS